MKFWARFLGWFEVTAPLQLEYGKLAEKYGFDYCWFPHDPFLKHSWVLASALAAQTKRIKVASGSNPYTFAPSELATYLATLDEISNGRAALGIGLHTTDMIGWVGIKAEDPVRRTREAVKLIRNTLRTSDKKKAKPFRGKEFQWTDQAYLRFKPYRENPPIYITAFGKEYLRVSGEIGDGSLPMLTPPESAAQILKYIQEGVAMRKPRPKDFQVAGYVWISISKDNPGLALKMMKRVIAYFGPYLEDEALRTVGVSLDDFKQIKKEVDRGRYDLASDLVTDDMLSLGITGTVSECTERIAQVGKMGITQVSLGGPWGPDIPQAIKTIGKEIIPRLRTAS